MNRVESIVAEWIRKEDVEAPLNIGSLRLDEVPNLPSNVKRLSLFANNLTTINSLPETLIELNISCNRIHRLSCELPPRLRNLSCDSNMLTMLPELPDTLEFLSCSNNRSISLPVFPPRLRLLDVAQNNLRFLPDLPPALETLFCHNNQLQLMPYLPPKLIFLLDYNNPFDLEHMRWNGYGISDYQTDTYDQIHKWLAHMGDRHAEERKSVWEAYFATFDP